MRPWDRTDQGPPLWSDDSLGLATADGLNSYSRSYAPLMFELITSLAEFEDRQASEVIDDILRAPGPYRAGECGVPEKGVVAAESHRPPSSPLLGRGGPFTISSRPEHEP